MFLPPKVNWRLVKDIGWPEDGTVSKGDFQAKSASAEDLEEWYGTIRRPVGCTIPEFINALKFPPPLSPPWLLYWLLTKVLNTHFFFLFSWLYLSAFWGYTIICE